MQWRNTISTIVAGSHNSSELPVARGILSIGRCIADCIKTLADYYAAAAKYEQLCRLSDAELKRRGFARATLARDLVAACDLPRTATQKD